MGAVLKIGPQPGPQEAFLQSSADIAIYGGAAGGGKSWAILLEALRHKDVKGFAAAFFRRTTVQIRNPGGLWDESLKLYPIAGGDPVGHVLEWRWPSGAKVKFSHLEHDSTVLEWQGAQVALLCFDELTHFSRAQFFYMLSRNRSTCGVRPYVRATTNPDADSWVAEFISWWIDPGTGLPIPERAGVLRWFVRIHDAITWSDSADALISQYGAEAQPKSLTFIPAKLEDNRALVAADPGYKANLQAMSRVERERLLGGNWKVRPAAGMYFKRADVEILELCPTDVEQWVRRWDLAATVPSEDNPDPDYTAGVKMGRRSNGRYVIADVCRDRLRSHDVRAMVKRVAGHDSIECKIGLPQDPGQAGKEQAESYVSALAGYTVKTARETGDKVTRADPFAAQWQAGNIDLVRGAWNEAFIAELEAFPSSSTHDDQVDAASGAFLMLTGMRDIFIG